METTGPLLPPILTIVNGITSFVGYEPHIKLFMKRHPTYDEQFTESLGRMVFVANTAIFRKDSCVKGSDESRRTLFRLFLHFLERIGKPIDMHVTTAQRTFVRPDDDTMKLRELRVFVEALLTGNATTPADDQGMKELIHLSALYGMVLMKLQVSALPSVVDKPPFKVEALVEDMQWIDGLFELTYRRRDGTRLLGVEHRHLDAIEELLKFRVKDTHSGVKEGRFPESFLKTLQEGLAGLKKRKSTWKEGRHDEDDADIDGESMHEEL